MGKEFLISEIADNSGHERCYVGTVNGEVIGRSELLIDKEKNEAEFRIHLIPRWQGQGLGYELTMATIDDGLNIHKLDRIWLGFVDGNEPARKVYEKAGFKYTVHQMEVRCTK